MLQPVGFFDYCMLRWELFRLISSSTTGAIMRPRCGHHIMWNKRYAIRELADAAWTILVGLFAPAPSGSLPPAAGGRVWGFPSEGRGL